jgi:hypothetical protein
MPLDTAFEPAASSLPAQLFRRAVGAGPVRARIKPNYFKSDTIEVRGPAGASIRALVEAAGIDVERYGGGTAWICDAAMQARPAFIPFAHWHRVRPHAGTVTLVELKPGQGGGGGKSILRIVLSLAVAAAAFFAAPLIAGALGFAASSPYFGAVVGGIAFGINVIGNLVIGALIPPPKPRPPEERLAGLADDRQGFHLQSAANRPRFYQPVPLHLGQLRRHADLGAEFFTEVVGNDHYLRFFVVWGLGPLKVSELKIGETPFALHEGAEARSCEGWADDGPPEIFTDDPHTEGLAIDMTVEAGWQERVTQPNTDETQIELAFPEGIFRFGLDDDAGVMFERTVTFEAEVAPAGSDDWAPIPWANDNEPGFETPGVISVTDRTRTGQPRRVGRIVHDAAGQYRIRMRRTSEEPSAPHAADRSLWVALKSIRYRLPLHPSLVGKVAYTEGRIKATGQIQGGLQELNAIVESYVRAIDDEGFVGSWDVPRADWHVSRNPAELYAHAISHPLAWEEPVPDDEIHFPLLADWRDDAAQIWTHGKPRFWFDRVYESESATLARMLDEIAAVGRAHAGVVDGRHGVIRDIPQAGAAHHFTEVNSANFRGTLEFPDVIHGFRVRYNEGGAGQETEIVVYADGYSEDGAEPGTQPASRLPTVEAIGQTDADQVWCLWRYHLAVWLLRGVGGYELDADIEQYLAPQGALVAVNHRVPGFGLASARLVAVVTDQEDEEDEDWDYLGVVLDRAVTMEAGKSYGLRLTNGEGTFLAEVAAAPGTTDTLMFAAPEPKSRMLARDDVAGFGELGRVSVDCLVTGLEPGDDQSARIVLVDAAPGVHEADLGPIPAFDQQISLPPADARDPAEPVVRAVKSDESVLLQRVGGALVVRVLIELAPPAGQPVPDWVQGRWRLGASSPWSSVSQRPAAGLQFDIEGPPQGETIQIELRNVTSGGRASNWKRLTHTVIGKTTPPPDVPGLFHEGEHIRWSYPAPPLDVTHGGGFRVKYLYGNALALPGAWAAAAKAHDDLVSGTAFPTSLLPPGELTVLAKAVDADGNESASPARLFTEIVAPAVANVVESYDFRAAGWPGTIAGAVISGGDLVADSASLFWGASDSPFWGAAGEPFWDATWEPIVYETAYVPPADALPARLTLAHEIEGVPRRILYCIDDRVFWGDDDDPFWAADDASFWDAGEAPEWRDWPGALDLPSAAEGGDAPVGIRIEAGGGASAGAVRALTATLDVEDVEELLLDVAIAAGGTALPVTKTYRKFVAVIPTLFDDGGDARGVRIKTALPSDAAPVVECLDAAGGTTDGRLSSAHVQGY